MLFLRCFVFCFVTLFIGEGLASRVEAQTQNEDELKNFYVVTHVVSDASPFKYEYVLDVKPQGKDVLVREIRIAPLSSGCPSGVTVKAADHVLTNITPKSVPKLDLCALKVGTVASAITGAQPNGVVASIDDTASYSIVAMCGKTEKVFEIPYPETVALEKLKKTNPRVASLWNLVYDISRRAFGKHFSFYNTSASQDEAFQTLGAEIVPAIKSGIYDRGFQNGSHLESLLNKYSGPVKEIEPWYVEFVGPVPADLLQYQLPKYPPLARQTRIEGEVHLVVVLEPQTGLPREVKVTSGHPLLTDAAAAAVRDWHFQVGDPRIDPIEVALRFILRCPTD
jgi:TonB family protein